MLANFKRRRDTKLQRKNDKVSSGNNTGKDLLQERKSGAKPGMEKENLNAGEIPSEVLHRNRVLCLQASSYQWFLKSLFPFPLPNPIPGYITEHQTNWVKENEC